MNIESIRPYIQINRPTDEELGFHFPDFSKEQEVTAYLEWAQNFLERHPPTGVERMAHMGPMSMMHWEITPEEEFPLTQEATFPDGQRKRVLIGSSHSDDTEITATAAIQDWKQRGYLVDILLMTAGTAGKYKLPYNEQTNQEVRVAEQLRAASAVGANRVYIPQLPLPNHPEIAEMFSEFPKQNNRDFQYGIPEWFWADVYGNSYTVDPNQLGIALRTKLKPSIILSPHPESDMHPDHQNTAKTFMQMWRNASSKSNYQHAYPGTVPLEAWFRTLVWGEPGRPAPNFNELVEYPIDSDIARLKTWLLFAYPSQSERYAAAQMGLDVGVGTYATIANRTGAILAHERFDVVRGAHVQRPKNIVPQRNVWQ